MKLYTTKEYWLYFFIIIGLGFQLYGTQCAPGITYDSNQYLASAKSFAKNQQLSHVDGTPHIDHVPLYPVILSLLGEHRLQLSKYLNALSLALVLALFIYLGKQTLHTPFVRSLFALTLVCSIPLQLIHHFVWSEPFFVLLLTLSLLFLFKYLQTPCPQYFRMLVVVGFFMCLQRNPGIFLVAGIALALWLYSKAGLWRTVLYGSLSVSGWVIWTVGGLLIVKSGLHPAAYNIFGNLFAKHNLDHYLNVISGWFLPITISLFVRGTLFLILILFLIIRLIKIKALLTGFTKALIIITIVYIVFLQLTERIDFHETERYAAVIFPLFALWLFHLYEKLLMNFQRKALLGANLVLLLWLGYPAIRTLKNVRLWHKRACSQGYIQKVTSDPAMNYYKPRESK